MTEEEHVFTVVCRGEKFLGGNYLKASTYSERGSSAASLGSKEGTVSRYSRLRPSADSSTWLNPVLLNTSSRYPKSNAVRCCPSQNTKFEKRPPTESKWRGKES